MSVACGNKVHSPEALEAFGVKQHHHESVAQVKLCFSGRPVHSVEEQGLFDQQEAEMAGEIAAEKANERYFEERGANTYAGSEEEARDRWFDSLSWEQAVATEQPGQSIEDAPPAQPAKVRCNLPSDWRDGVYTIETPKGHRTLRFRTQDSDSDFKPGLQLVAYLNGPSNDFARGDWTQFGHVEKTRHGGVLKVWFKHRTNKDLDADWLTFTSLLVTDPEAILRAVYCFRCHALLTVPESIAAGWGPECLKKGLR